jgi:hypothetical protein
MGGGEFLKLFSEYNTWNLEDGDESFLSLFLDNQEKLKGNGIDYKQMSPYEFQLSSAFRKVVLKEKENKLQVIIVWHNKERIGAEFNLDRLNILINEEGITFEDMKSECHRKKITILFK